MSSVTFIDPRLDTSVTPSWYRYAGVENYQVYDIPASSLSDSMISFSNMTTLGRNMLYLDDVTLSYTVRFSLRVSVDKEAITAIPPNLSLPSDPPPRWLSLRPFPLSNCMTTVNTIINGIQAASYPRDTLQMLGQMRDVSKIAQRIDDSCPISFTNEALCRSRYYERNPTYVSGAFPYDPTLAPSDEAMPREDGTWGNVRPLTNVGTEVNLFNAEGGSVHDIVFTVTIREPLLCCPFNQDLSERFPKPVWGIENMEIRVWLSQLHRMLNVAARYDFGLDAAVTQCGLNTQFTSATIERCSLRYGVITAPSSMPVPPIFMSPITQFIPLITNIDRTFSPADVDTQHQVTSNIFTFTSVPQAIYIYIGRSTLSWDRPFESMEEVFETLPIENVDITLGNNTKIMYTLQPEDLAFISRKNGVKMTTRQWLGTQYRLSTATGRSRSLRYQKGVLALIPGIDIVVPGEELVPGTPASFGDGGKMTFQVTVRFRYTGMNYDGTLSMFIFFQNIGTYALTGSSGSIDMIPLGAGTGTGMGGGGSSVIPMREVDQMYGGGFLDSIGRALKKVWDSGIISKGLGMIPHPIAQGIGGVVGALGGGVNLGGGLCAPPKKRFGGAPIPKDYFL